MWLSFYPMDQNLYLTIVEHYLAKTDMPMNDEAHAEALRWCQARSTVRTCRLSVLNTGFDHNN